MLTGLFRRDADVDYRWEFFDPVLNGTLGYVWSLSSFTSLVPEYKGKFVVIDGMSQFRLRDGLIAEYRESVNGGVAMAQLGVEPARMAKVMTPVVGLAEGSAGDEGVSGKAKGWRQNERDVDSSLDGASRAHATTPILTSEETERYVTFAPLPRLESKPPSFKEQSKWNLA